MTRSRFSRDNIGGNQGGLFVSLFLFPGMILQWGMYVLVAGERYGAVREQTRLARSPLMTWVFSAVFWLLLIALMFHALG